MENNLPKVVQVAKLHLGVSEKNDEYLKYTQGREESWCADFVGSVFEQAYGKPPFGYVGKDKEYMSAVKSLKSFGEKENIFKPANDVVDVGKQISQMKPGDMVIFKKDIDLKVEAESGEMYQRVQKSHVGIVSGVNEKDNTVSVIEGNANDFKYNEKGEILIEQKIYKTKGGLDAASVDFATVNAYDSVMEKVYPAEKLFEFGYVGYLDMQNKIAEAEQKQGVKNKKYSNNFF